MSGRQPRDEWQSRQLRERIGREAARLLLSRSESDFRRAARRAARRFGRRGTIDEMPTPHEIREHLRRLAEAAQASALQFDPVEQRLEALRLMRLLRQFEPQLAKKLSEPRVDLRVFADDFEAVTDCLRAAGIAHSVQPERHDPTGQPYTPIAIYGEWPARMQVLPAKVNRSDWRAPDGAIVDATTLQQLEVEMSTDGDRASLEDRLDGIHMDGDRFELFRYLLDRLEGVKQDRRTHPEGDALHHSLQVFDLAMAERPFDEEFLTAALLHDVGKAIATLEPAAASIDALHGAITHRTRWLIEHLPAASALAAGKLGIEERHLLEAAEDFDDLMTLVACDAKGRIAGKQTSTIDEALGQLRTLAAGGY